MKSQNTFLNVICLYLTVIITCAAASGALAAPAYNLSRSAPYSWYLDGILQELKGEYARAYSSFKTAWEFDQDTVPILTELARVAIRIGRMDEAEEWIERALFIQPENIRLKMMLARIFASGNNPGEAIEVLNEVLDQEPDNEEALFLQGSLYAQMEKLPEAIKALEKAADQKGTRSFMAHYYLGKIYLEKNETARAKEEFLKAIAANPRFIPIYIDLAEAYEADHDTENALEIWRMLLKKQPENSRAAAKLIDLLLQAERLDEAVKVLDSLNSASVDRSALRFKIAIMCLQKERPHQALAMLEPMAAKHPDNSQIIFYMALALEQSGRIDDAINKLESIDVNDRLGVEASIRVAYLLHSKGRDQEAEKFLEKRMAASPENPQIILALARLYEDNGRVSNAESLLKNFINSGRNDKEILMQLAMVCENHGRRKEALYWAGRALDQDSDYVPALNLIGYTWAEQGINLDQAEKMVKKAVSLRPEDGFIIDSLGWVYFAQGRYDEAVEQLEKAFRLVPDDATIAEHLGDALIKKQKYFKALKIYKKAMELEKNKKNRRHLQKKIRQAADMMSDMVDQ